MNILALEPYFGGSHQAFLEGWATHSRHTFTIFDLPARKWKWRMRHAALTLAERVRAALDSGPRWDLVFCSDMLNLAEFIGLAPPAIHALPRIAYFHENQLTYPFRYFGERDFHFGFTNMTTAAAADAVWFNSAFHRGDFLGALHAALKRMPDFQPLATVDAIRMKSHIQHPGVNLPPPRGPRLPGPLRILWAARWEHDKNPALFFDALRRLQNAGVDFRVSVVGEQFQDVPADFEQARAMLADRIDRWGYQSSRAEYIAALHEADVVVSTADHEFFGISVVEAVAAGCYPLLPRRLAYPELLDLDRHPERGEFYYDGGVTQLSDRLGELGQSVPSAGVTPDRSLVERFGWDVRAAQMDAAVDELVASDGRSSSALA